MRKILPVISSLVLLSSMAVADAKGPRMLNGQVSEDRVERLTNEINWHYSLPAALSEAQKTGKLVVWIHMLGKIDGAT